MTLLKKTRRSAYAVLKYVTGKVNVLQFWKARCDYVHVSMEI